MNVYILDVDGNPVLEPDVSKWAKWFETADRRVALTEIGDANISTVFLGLDHNWYNANQEPILYETMVFWKGHELDEEQDRYSTRDEALAGHEEMVARVRSVEK